MDDPQLSRIGGIAYSCYTKLSRVAENFVPVHVFTYIESGSLLIVDGQKEVMLRKGDFAFYAKNTLAKFTKMPSGENGEYKSLSVRIDEGVLREMAANLTVAASVGPKAGILKLEFDKDLELFSNSLINYLNVSGQLGSELLKLKVREITLLLLEKKPELASVLFDFNQPGKIVLKDFMLRNFHFNVSVERFAFLTGRSLSGFKRDFELIFGASPRRWLQQKRLEEARFMIGSGRKPSEVYVDVGFENLSHFSSAFKKAFGVQPSSFRKP